MRLGRRRGPSGGRGRWIRLRRTARFLRETYDVSRVVVFGSAARGRFFDEHSDLDRAVWGLDDRLYFRAQGQVLAFHSDVEPEDVEPEIDLVRYEDARSALREAIDREGVDVQPSLTTSWLSILLEPRAQ